MVRTPGLGRIILALALLAIVLLPRSLGRHTEMWDPRLMPSARPRRNLERWLRRWARRQRQRLQPKRPRRRRAKRKQPSPTRAMSTPPLPLYLAQRKVKAQRATATPSPAPPDPLADLRDRRGWVDCIPWPELWKVLVRIRWPDGPCCPHCGERDPRYLELIDPTYRDGLARWRCQICAEAGGPGEGGTFTPLTGTILDGMRVDIRIFEHSNIRIFEPSG